MATGVEEFILYLVFAAGTAVSLFAFLWGRRLKLSGRIPGVIRDDPAFQEIAANGLVVAGETEVEAPTPQAVMDVLALNLQNPLNYANSAWSSAGGRVGQIHVERPGALELSFTAEGLGISEGLVRAQGGAVAGTMRVRWALHVPGAGRLITVGQAWALLLGVPASIIVPAVIFLYVLPARNPAVRGQFLQVLQVCQLLWEPFMFVGMSSRRLAWAGNCLELLIAAAAFEARTGRPAVAAAPAPPSQGWRGAT
ncbi:MAG: hypothetical protein NTW87_22200 [Planctomycetota bacterium]|nr:hypothetical protein [Planctomycetota bacterium]